jgi:hypothetical protein
LKQKIDFEETFLQHPENEFRAKDCPYCAKLENKLRDRGNEHKAKYIRCAKHAALQSFHHKSLNPRYHSRIDIRRDEDEGYLVVEGDGHIEFVYLRKDGQERLVLPRYSYEKEKTQIFTFIPTEKERKRLAEIIAVAMKYGPDDTVNTRDIELYDLILRLVLQEAVC